MSARRSRRLYPRPQHRAARLQAHSTNTSGGRETLLTPAKGKRLRLLQVRIVQEQAAGPRRYEVYFGPGASSAADPSKAVDTLEIPDSGEASTRLFPVGEGPRGQRDEPLSGRWQGDPPAAAHQVIIEYTTES